MKKKLLLLIALVIANAISVDAKTFVNDVETYNVKATAYCLDGTTATGTETRLGIVASKPEWYGCMMCVWLDRGNGIEPTNFIGVYSVEDTGGKPIKNGKVIDIWLPTKDACKEFGSQNVIIQVIRGNG